MKTPAVHVVKDDLFNAPAGSIIAHACNCQGVWGSGIAKLFKEKYPDAYEVYHQHCVNSTEDKLIGTCLLIPGEKHHVACLFTSKNFGGKVDTPPEILRATQTAVVQMIRENRTHAPINLCKINSGLFNVPWDDTMQVLESFGTEMCVYEF